MSAPVPAMLAILTLLAAGACQLQVAPGLAWSPRPAVAAAWGPGLQRADVGAVVQTAAETALRAWSAFRAWLADSYRRAPALVLGLAALVALPALAAIGAVLRWPARARDATRLLRRGGLKGGAGRDGTGRTERGPVWPAAAYIEIEGVPGHRYPVGRSVLRVGREADNDLVIAEKTVHRYHAAIHCTEDSEFVITDLSSQDGNGVLLNGRRIAEARLVDGDRIEFGAVSLRFTATPA